MIEKPISKITTVDLDALIGTTHEDKTLEFKSEMPGKAADDLIPFLAGISSLANTMGGDFILGVTAKDGLAIAIPGIALDNLDAEKLRLEQLLASGIEPRLPHVDIQPIACGPGRYVLVLRMHRSWVGPHRVKKNNAFYGRNSGGRYPLDVGELRTAFVLSETATERIRAFRAERITKIVADNAPLPLAEGGKVILHVVPLPSFADRRLIDIVPALGSGHFLPIPLDGGNMLNQARINLDGFLNYVQASPGKTASYAQAFRSGAIEGVSLLDRDADGAYIHGVTFANKIVAAIRQYINVLKLLDIGFPVIVCVSLCGVGSCCFRYAHNGPGYGVAGPFHQDIVILPEVTIDDENSDILSIIRPIFNMVWNAFGFMQCDMYTDQGKWKGL